MKSATVTFVFLLTLVRLAAAEGESTVRFSNNDHLSGSLESLTTEKLVWKSPILEKPAPFLLEKVLELTMAAEQPVIDARHEASITLTNGDLVRGQLAGVSEDAVELDTWYAGRMKFNRLMISDIRIAERPDLIYRGPNGLDGWKQSGDKPAWIYQNSGFRSTGSGSIARDVKLPQECSVAFDIEWRDRFMLKFVVFSDDLSSDRPTSGYELQFQQRNVSLRSCKGQRFIGHSPNAAVLQENEKAHVEVRASSKSGKISLYLDGQVIENWTDTELARNEFGKGIHFISQTTVPLQVSRIEVGVWDGETEKVPDPQFQAGRGFGEDMQEDPEPAPEVKPKAGRMEMRNGDSIAGEVVSINGGLIVVKTPFKEVKLPIESLRSLSLKPVDLERCIRKNGDVRAWFPDGSSLVFRLDEVGDGTLTGFSQNFGTARFKLSAFNRIEFNIYSPEFEDIRTAGAW
ncbi:MAG: hypothetical protein ABIS50_19585 [Luteolibacter sp.]|uniref:hypothetical protein n=1 Tax=Luteolibacter sp. TaxID=1962973 RepID=UPI003264F973